MRMPRNLSIVMLVVLTLSRPLPGLADEPSKEEVSSLVSTYLQAADAAGKASAITSLKSAERALIRDAIKEALVNPSTRARALELATALRVGALYPELRSAASTADEGLAMEAMLCSRDRMGHAYVLDRFENDPVLTPGFRHASRLLKENGLVATEWLARMKSHLGDVADPRHWDALLIIKYQLGAASSDASVLLSEWDVLEREYRIDARLRPKEGNPLSDRVGVESKGIKWVGPNILITPGGSLEINPLPLELQNGNWRIMAWIRVVPTETGGWRDGVKVRLLTETASSVAGIDAVQGQWNPVFNSPTTVATRFGPSTVDNRTRVMPFKPGEWSMIEWRWVDQGTNGRETKSIEYKRLLDLLIDKEPIVRRAELDGRLRSIAFTAGAKSRLTVGGIAYARPQ